MTRLVVNIAADGLSAAVKVSAGPAATRAELDAELRRAGVVHGLDQAALQALTELLRDPAQTGEHIVARGDAPQHGADGRLDPAFTLGQIVGEVCKDGHVDFHERRLLQPIADGEHIASVHAPTAGTPGTDVRGRTLPAKPGVAARFRLGPGARLTDTNIVATRGGVILADDKSVDVVPLYQHRGDVDLESGNLHSEGSLEIAGDVCDGFAATASGDVLVHGLVQSASVTAQGSVHVDQGVLGAESQVTAGVDLSCRHATAAQLQAGGTILVRDQLAHCRARAERILLVEGRGQAFGGELRARVSIEVSAAGTKEGAATLLAIADLLDERAGLAQLTSEAARATRVATRGDNAGGRISKGKGTRLAVRAEDRSETERLRLIARQRELLANASVVIRDVAHVGVRIQLGDLVRHIDAPRHAVRYRYDRDQHQILEEYLP
ncbi:MAG: DUF342 domain-containing protein [Planctomycetes bacterium]|nr:DUF342 domain-containing protein [Planctomycetota bacterium]MCB9885591.1 DUF342 domain-containing protein [Planctomycetota bacterium]